MSIDTAGATLLLELRGADTLAALVESATGLSYERKALVAQIGCLEGFKVGGSLCAGHRG